MYIIVTLLSIIHQPTMMMNYLFSCFSTYSFLSTRQEIDWEEYLVGR